MIILSYMIWTAYVHYAPLQPSNVHYFHYSTDNRQSLTLMSIIPTSDYGLDSNQTSQGNQYEHNMYPSTSYTSHPTTHPLSSFSHWKTKNSRSMI